jgi:hypothetical protein
MIKKFAHITKNYDYGSYKFNVVLSVMLTDYKVKSDIQYNFRINGQISPFTTCLIYSETSIHRFRQGSEKETMDPRKQ